MFIFEKIKAWWIARKEAKRAWQNAPIEAQLRGLSLALSVHVEKEIDNLRKDVLQHIHDVEWRVFDKLKEHRAGIDDTGKGIFSAQQQIGALKVSLFEQIAQVSEQIKGVQSRYQWVEERYHEITKTGVAPREFNYENRQ